mmetsp:Transcript_96826/g.172285  ORF Transcript_96826/g.172285 Transcript_96826/m.172285 type:complete len:722 (-) Transcript_96826:130-2295(-)
MSTRFGAMARSAIRPADAPTSSVGKSRPPLTQMMAGVVLFSMGLLIIYMYQVIDGLHREQEDMRLQLNALANGRYHVPDAPPHLIVPPRAQFLDSRGGSAAALHRLAEEASAKATEDRTLQGKGSLLEEEVYPGSHAVFHEEEDPEAAKKRRLMGMYTTGTSAGVGCFELSDAAANNIDVSSATGCNSNICPDCFVTPATVSQAVTLTVTACSSAKWLRGNSRTGVWLYTFINSHATEVLTITDNSGTGKTTYNVPGGSYVTAYCASTLGTSNRLYFPSTQMPTLTVDDALTLSAGNFNAGSSSGTFTTSSGTNTLSGNVAIAGTKTFATGTGAVTLAGATTVSDSTAFTVGSAGSGGTTTLYGNVVVGDTGSGNGASITHNGNFLQQDVTGAAATFTTGTSGITLNGHTTIASGKNLELTSSGAGQLTTGTGAITLNGAVTISGSNSLTTGTGAIALNGDTAVAASKTLTVGTAGSGGATTLYGNTVIGATAAGGAATLTVNGNMAQGDVTGDAVSTLSTGGGAVSLNGDVTVAQHKNLYMVQTGTGAFRTGTGAISLNGNTEVTGSNTFTSGTGAVTLQGSVALADNVPFTVGSVGNGGGAQFFGTVIIGGSSGTGMSTSLTVHGDVAFNNDNDGTPKTFSTGTGAIALNGDVSIAANKDLLMANSGNGQFRTGTGNVNLNGDVTVESSKSLTIAQYTNQIVCTHSSSEVANTYCMASR